MGITDRRHTSNGGSGGAGGGPGAGSSGGVNGANGSYINAGSLPGTGQGTPTIPFLGDALPFTAMEVGGGGASGPVDGSGGFGLAGGGNGGRPLANCGVDGRSNSGSGRRSSLGATGGGLGGHGGS